MQMKRRKRAASVGKDIMSFVTSDQIKNEHARVLQLLEELLDEHQSYDAIKKNALAFRRIMRDHLEEEKEVFSGCGKGLIAKLSSHHDILVGLLDCLTDIDPCSINWSPFISDLVALLRHHFKKEELMLQSVGDR